MKWIFIWRQNINLLKLKEWRSLSLKVFFNFWRKKLNFAIFCCCSEWPSVKKGISRAEVNIFFFWLTQKSERNRERYALFVVDTMAISKYWNYKKPLLSARKKFFFYFIHFVEKKKYYFTSLYCDPTIHVAVVFLINLISLILGLSDNSVKLPVATLN